MEKVAVTLAFWGKDMDESKIAALDTRLVKAARLVQVLNDLAWPAGSDEKFLSGFRGAYRR